MSDKRISYCLTTRGEDGDEGGRVEVERFTNDDILYLAINDGATESTAVLYVDESRRLRKALKRAEKAIRE